MARTNGHPFSAIGHPLQSVSGDRGDRWVTVQEANGHPKNMALTRSYTASGDRGDRYFTNSLCNYARAQGRSFVGTVTSVTRLSREGGSQ